MVVPPEAAAHAEDAVGALAATVGAGTVVVARRSGDRWTPLAASDRAGLLRGDAWGAALDAVVVAGRAAPLDAWPELRTVVVAPVPLPPSEPMTVIAVLDDDAIDVGQGQRTLIRAYAEFLGRQLPSARSGRRRGGAARRRRSRRSVVEPARELDDGRTIELLQRRRRLVSEVVHDLRAPLAVIGGNAHLIAAHPDDPGRVEHHARVITSQVKRMSTMVDGLLEAEGRELGVIVELPSEVDLAGLIDVVVEETEQLLTTTSVEVVGEGAGTVRTQRVALHRLLMNLTANAAKSTRTGRIHITAVRWGDGAVLTVRDTGSGMTPDQVARLEDGHRGGRGVATTGFGLGLSIVVRLARQLGGTAEVDTFTGTGTSVTVWIPDQHPGAEDPTDIS